MALQSDNWAKQTARFCFLMLTLKILSKDNRLYWSMLSKQCLRNVLEVYVKINKVLCYLGSELKLTG